MPELTRAAEARDAAIRALGLAERALEEVSGDNEAARLAQERRTLLEEIRDETERGLRRRIGLVLAERALGRYRDQHRGAMLAATEEAFVELTGGAYSGLSAQKDGSGEALIAHRAADGRSLRADEKTMSKGTRFQLYLALRLAGYRQMADAGHGPAVPVRRHLRDLRRGPHRSRLPAAAPHRRGGAGALFHPPRACGRNRGA